jgi:hypothetical protein
MWSLSTQMVNTGFLQSKRYGFEMVDGRLRGLNQYQSKIYAESNQANFSRNLRDLTSMQTLAIYRRKLGPAFGIEGKGKERRPE